MRNNYRVGFFVATGLVALAAFGCSPDASSTASPTPIVKTTTSTSVTETPAEHGTPAVTSTTSVTSTSTVTPAPGVKEATPMATHTP